MLNSILRFSLRYGLLTIAVAVVVLVLSLAGTIAAAGRAPHMSHLSAGTLATMLLMQVASAAGAMWILTTVPRRRRGHR